MSGGKEMPCVKCELDLSVTVLQLIRLEKAAVDQNRRTSTAIKASHVSDIKNMDHTPAARFRARPRRIRQGLARRDWLNPPCRRYAQRPPQSWWHVGLAWMAGCSMPALASQDDYSQIHGNLPPLWGWPKDDATQRVERARLRPGESSSEVAPTCDRDPCPMPVLR